MSTTSASLPETGKPPKSSRRKMSWFKQASIGEKLTRLRLPRQNTLDCPSSAPVSAPPGAERLTSRRRIVSGSASVEALGSSETAWVTRDFTGHSPGQVSLKAGQQVEILDLTPDPGGLVKVRVEVQEGLVPVSCLQLGPRSQELCEDLSQISAAGSVSPVNKRRVFSGKWLPSIRKLSHGKERSQSIGGHDSRQLQKQQDKTKFKFGQSSVDVGMGNKTSHPLSEPEDPELSKLPPSGRSRTRDPTESIEEAEDVEVEVPPPMRPISSIPAPGGEDSKPRDPGQTSTHSDWNGVSLSSSCVTPGPSDSSSCDQKENSADGGESADPVTKAIEQRSYRLQELLESEKMYVSDLEQVYTYITYMRESKEKEEADIPMPDDLREGRDRMIFGNLENIYEWHRDNFSKNLEKCIENPVELGNLFKKSEKKFQMYVVYCQNKPKSEFIVSVHIDTYFEEIRLKYGFKLRLNDLLIKPIQRLTKYHMLLEAILKHSERAGLTEEAAAIQSAFHVMTIVPNQANDMMDIGRLQGFEGKIVAQGKLLLHGPLLCTDDPASGPNYKLKEMTVFLFEQIIIFAETVGRKSQFTSPVYTYKAHIQVNNMQFEEKVEADPEHKMFRVRSTCRKGPALTFICQAENTEQRNRWTGTMTRQLQTQKEFLQALSQPIAYHNKLMKEL